ncbi:sensor histidine kinase [Agromyces sp. NPDC055658]
MRELAERADAMVHTQGRLQALLRATQVVVEHAELPVVLERIAQSAVELVDAEYGALGVIAADGDGLEAFIHVGISDDAAAAIGHLPEGRGVLGALIDDPRPIRLQHISDHPRSVGFPAGHPSMDAFLGVPIRVRAEVYGNLYLSNPRRGLFTEEDEQLVTALAATAGFVIANARLLEETRQRQRWMAASAHITAALLESVDGSAPAMLADELITRTTANRVCVILPDGDEPPTVRVAEARGDGAAEVTGRVVPAATTGAGEVFERGEPAVRPGGRHVPAPDALAILDGSSAGAVMFLPLRSDSGTWGVLAVARHPSRPAFSAAELDIAADLVDRVALALELARARERQQRALLVEDRSRIARDLHDHVIQQLFGTGLELQSIAETINDARLSERIRKAVATLDEDIMQIRTIVFAMTPRPGQDESLRHRVLDIASECSPGLSQPITVSFDGPVDLTVDGALADDVTATVRELLTNAVRHASAHRVSVAVAADDLGVGVKVEDDGVGLPEGGRRSGIENIAARARARGGTFAIDSIAGRTTAAWRAPFEREAP